jgi:predicted dinucleotide-binding enzyme
MYYAAAGQNVVLWRRMTQLNIGGTLGRKWAAAGHTIVFGVREVSNSKAGAAAVAAGGNTRVDTIANAIAGAEVVVYAFPGAVMAASLRDDGAGLDRKIVIDTTNQFGQPVMNAIATILAAAPNAIVYRAFNSVGFENMAEPLIDGIQADMLYVGPNFDRRLLCAISCRRAIRRRLG